MSIYRSTYRGIPAAADVSHFAPGGSGASGASAPRPEAPGQPDPGAARWGHLRKAIGDETLRPETVRWAAGLPEDARPYALMKQYPRLANRVAVAAREPQAFASCIADLLIDRRGERRGFPSEVSQSLFRLRDHYEHLFAATAATDDRFRG
jgi:hypothetical protein